MTMTARPTTYRGVEMRSRLEAGFAQWLDSAGFAWEYEPRAFAGEAGQYLPDFRVSNLMVGSREEVGYLEVKPAIPEPYEPLRDRMAIIWESEPDVRLLIVCPGYSDPYLRVPAAIMLPRKAEFGLVPAIWAYRQDSPRYSLQLPIAVDDAPMAPGFWGLQ